MFGRRRKQEEAAAEAVREADRRALFAQLASRPENVCPFLGLADDRVGYHDTPGDAHRCYAFGDPAPLSTEQQSKVCLDRGYGNCPRYLRGVLVIPTDELEALRRPVPRVQPVVAPAAPPRRRRRGGAVMLVAFALLLLLVGGGAYLAANGYIPGVALGSSSPTPSTAPSTPPASGSPSASASPTPIIVPSTGALPTPGPSDRFTGYGVVVEAGTYPVVRLDANDQPVENTRTIFDHRSGAPVRPIDGADGTRYWLTEQGGYAGMAYVPGLSGGFRIYRTYESPDAPGGTGFVLVEDPAASLEPAPSP